MIYEKSCCYGDRGFGFRGIAGRGSKAVVEANRVDQATKELTINTLVLVTPAEMITSKEMEEGNNALSGG